MLIFTENYFLIFIAEETGDCLTIKLVPGGRVGAEGEAVVPPPALASDSAPT